MISLDFLVELFHQHKRNAEQTVRMGESYSPEQIALLAVYDKGYEDGIDRAKEALEHG